MSLNKLYAYQMGLDCGRNGPNEKNCHFSIFSKREYTDAWEKGKADAEEGNVSKLPTSEGSVSTGSTEKKRFPQDFIDGLTDLELVAMWKEMKDMTPVEDADYIKQLDDECKKRLERHQTEMKASI